VHNGHIKLVTKISKLFLSSPEYAFAPQQARNGDGKFTHNILVWIHENSKTILFAFLQDGHDVVHEFKVIFSPEMEIDVEPRET
jgi:hypothetical protein